MGWKTDVELIFRLIFAAAEHTERYLNRSQRARPYLERLRKEHDEKPFETDAEKKEEFR